MVDDASAAGGSGRGAVEASVEDLVTGTQGRGCDQSCSQGWGQIRDWGQGKAVELTEARLRTRSSP